MRRWHAACARLGVPNVSRNLAPDLLRSLGSFFCRAEAGSAAAGAGERGPRAAGAGWASRDRCRLKMHTSGPTRDGLCDQAAIRVQTSPAAGFAASAAIS